MGEVLSESQLEKSCITEGEARGFMIFRPGKFWSRNNGRRKNDLGAPDLFVFHDGTATGIELKVGSNIQSPEQLTFEGRLFAAGIQYYIVKTLDEFISILEHL